eukprot:COSAG01_NODE_58_length_30193_cov_12.302020_31_plen_66_part_00
MEMPHCRGRVDVGEEEEDSSVYTVPYTARYSTVLKNYLTRSGVTRQCTQNTYSNTFALAVCYYEC